MMAYLLGADDDRLKADGVLYGRLLETFVLNELVRLKSWSRSRIHAYHYRTHQGSEIDFLLERGDGNVVAIEVKSSSTVDSSSFAAIITLAQELKKKFVRGIVLYNGKEVIPFGKNLFALPIQTLWT
ncbi:MAG TPA: hypothetical protein DEP53_15760 [Bacteroidetes bacterium]|nr:hypothetical protein [Bacteroidota bacterium]